MNTRRNEFEDAAYTSIDNLANEIWEVCEAAIEEDVRAEYIADYLKAEMKGIDRCLRIGIMRPFDEIYDEFIDELIANGRYSEWMEFLRHRKEAADVHL